VATQVAGHQADQRELALEELPITPRQVAEVAALVEAKTINSKVAKQVVDFVLAGEGEPGAIVEAKGLRQLTDTGAIEAAVNAALAAHPAQAAQYAANPKILGFFVGQVMRATGGKANPGVVNELLKEKLGG